jgi:squalene-associated FAD-dependent desaturase
VVSAQWKPPPPHVVIVGGGLAGLATAVGLAGRGLKITVVESRPRLGGRASSFSDPTTGELVDNCQHVSMACCTNLADFCRRVGTSDLFRDEPTVRFLSPSGRLSRLRAGPWPAPLHLAGSFLRANYLTWGDKLRVIYAMHCLLREPPEPTGESFAEWLLRHRQTIRTINLYWATVLVSALNERLEQMDVGHARKVFVDGFLKNRHGYRMEIPLVPLGELYGSRLARWFETNDIDLRLNSGARAIDYDDERGVAGVALRSGESIAADFVVLAVPFDRAPSLVPEPLRGRIPGLGALSALRASPITGVHLWFDRPVCPYDHIVILGRTIQWIFNHTALQGRVAPPGTGEYLQIVISAAYDLLPLDNTAIRDLVVAELGALWPAAREASLLHWRVVTEHGATFAVRPGVDALRPPQRTPIEGLFLAGDWTATGWPATMEGAVRSGYLAATGVLQDLGTPDSLVQPDLPPSRLAQWLLKTPDERRGRFAR